MSKKIGGLLAVVLCFGVVAWMAYGQEKPKAPPKDTPKEKTVTITESQLNTLIESKIAQQLIDDTLTLDQKVLESKNWHYAYYRGVEYCVYTGPGQMLSTRWAPPEEKPKPETETPEKPAKKVEKPIEK